MGAASSFARRGSAGRAPVARRGKYAIFTYPEGPMTDEILTQVVRAMSHDLKSPVRGIAFLARLVAEEEAGLSAPTLQNLATIESRARQLDAMIVGLVAWARIGADEPAAELRLDELVPEVVTSLEIPRGIEVRFLELPVVRGPRTSLETVVRHLVDNAIRHHDGPPGCVTITARSDGATCTLSVEDDGPGIDQRFHECIFDLFRTLAPRNESGRGGGLGLGLSLVGRIAAALGGSVRLESAPGEGTRVEFEWPMR